MKQVRRNVFETNSSSTHCLTINKCALDAPIDESLFLKEYDIFAGWHKKIKGTWPEIGVDDGRHFANIQDRLTYLVKICLMCIYSEEDMQEDFAVIQLLNLLKEIFPNTDFSKVTPEAHEYYFEDGDCWFDSWREDIPIEKFLDKDKLMHLLQYGDIYFGNRDSEAFSDFISCFYNSNRLTATCSG